MKGIIDFLVSKSEDAKILRKYYVFYIVPMLNPDGVIYGNYRCSLLGFDLNRKWKHPDKVMQPTIYYTKKAIKGISEKREISLFCDLHGHSMKKNVFIYGCSFSATDIDFGLKCSQIRVFPLLMSQLSSNFCYKSSCFKMEKSKESTSRIVIFKEFNVLNSYTCEASLFGY